MSAAACFSNKLFSQSEREVSTAEGQKLAKEINAVSYMECSSLTGQGVDELFEKTVETGLEWKRTPWTSYMRNVKPWS